MDSMEEGGYKTVKIDSHLHKVVKKILEIAVEYERLLGRKLGITGEIGEVLVCDKLGLRLVANPRSNGFDAIDAKGHRVQIKTRRSEKNELPSASGRISRFSNHPFDYAILALLDRTYKVRELWKASYKDVKKIVKREQDDRRGPTIHSFKKVSRRLVIFPRKSGHNEELVGVWKPAQNGEVSNGGGKGQEEAI